MLHAVRLAFGNEYGIAIIDIVQKTCLLSMGTPDLYGMSLNYILFTYVSYILRATHMLTIFVARCMRWPGISLSVTNIETAGGLSF